MASSAGGGSSSGSGSGSRFRDLFQNPLPANPTLIESLSTPWRPTKPTDHSSFTEIFGELHFREPTYEDLPPSLLSPPAPTSKDVNLQHEIEKLDGDGDKNNENEMKPSSDSLFGGIQENQYMKSSKSTGTTGFSLKKAESLQLCTEGLGFESSGDVETKDETEDDWNNIGKGKMSITKDSTYSGNMYAARRFKQIQGSYPPPITCLGKDGKPWVSLKAYRYDGRFILKQIKIPNKEILHANREDGRLTLHLVQRDDESSEADKYDDAYEQEDEEADADEQKDKGEEEKSEVGNVKVEGNQ